jgi:hypothetical protein
VQGRVEEEGLEVSEAEVQGEQWSGGVPGHGWKGVTACADWKFDERQKGEAWASKKYK